MLCVMAILAILIAAGCTPSLRPHDRVRGTSGIAVESPGKAMISITPRNAAAGRREPLLGRQECCLAIPRRETQRTPRGSAPGTLSHSDNGRLSTPWREVIFLLTVMDSLLNPSSPALVCEPKSAFR